MAIQPQATRSLRRVNIRTPGSRVVTHFLKRKPKTSKCGNCGQELKGIPRQRPSVFRNLPLTKKTVSRPYGGNLCSKCSRKKILEKIKDLKEKPLEIGQLCIKTAGREAGNICVIVDKIDDNFVLIDGQVKRKKCNILHIKTIDKNIEIRKNESSDIIKKEFKKLGYDIKEKKIKPAKNKKTEQKKEEKPKTEENKKKIVKKDNNAKRSTKKIH